MYYCQYTLSKGHYDFFAPFLQLDIARIIVFFTREPILEEPNLKILNSIHTKIFAAIIFVGISLAVISFL